MQITAQIKLLPTAEQTIFLNNIMQEYIHTVNGVVDCCVQAEAKLKLTSKNVIADLPSA